MIHYLRTEHIAILCAVGSIDLINRYYNIKTHAPDISVNAAISSIIKENYSKLRETLKGKID